MSSNLVIAAIPDENDRVWKISSEKIPHLTLLFLGDVDAVSNLDQIMLFVEHAASTSLKRFYLPVDRRDKLGDDEADVLFFKKGRYDYKAIRDFRLTLLQDQNIKTAYDSSEQFDGPWQPHLTLGYPETPAKPLDDNESFSFFDVSFNKIAVWTGDFEGPDFLLKDYGDEFDEMDVPIPMDVAMSDIHTSKDEPLEMAQTADLGSKFLAHHGVKGMRWGVRKSEDAGGGSGPGGKKLDAVKKGAKELAKFGGDISFENQAMDGRARDKILNHANETFKQSTLPAIKAKPEHQQAAKLKNRLRHPFSPEAKAYRKDVKESYIKQLEQSANAMTNSSQNRQFTIRERGIELPSQGGDLPRSKTYWEVSTRPITTAGKVGGPGSGTSQFGRRAKHDALEHADEQFATLEVLTDNDGWITGLKKVDPETVLAQTMDLGATLVASLIEDGDQLEHYGTKGMHWGVRNNAATGIRRNRMEPRMAPAPTDVRAISRVPPGKRRKTKIETDGGENHPATDDAMKVAVNRTKLHKSGPAALTNKELQEVANRIELEARVKRATQPGAQKFISNLLRNQGNQQANQFVQEQFKKRRTSGAPA